MNILYVTYGLPYPPHSGGSRRDLQILTELTHSHRVTLLCAIDEPANADALAELERRQIHTHAFPLNNDAWQNKFGALFRHLRARRPLATLPFYSEPLAECLCEQLRSQDFDIVQIEHSFLAPYVDAIPKNFKGRRILTFHNIGVEQYQRIATLDLGWKHRVVFWVKWQMMLGWEARYAQRFDRLIVMSKRDGVWLHRVNPGLQVSVIEYSVDADAHIPLAEYETGHSLLFVGTMGYPPNVDAMLWFVREIFPRILQQIPDTQLTIAGRAPTLAIQKLTAHPNITVTGHVDDLQTHYQRAQVVIVPLRAGGGTRVKIPEAMAFGRAIVSTTIGCEGLAVQNGENILIADEIGEFANAVVTLLRDRAQRELLTHNARSLVESRYNSVELKNKLERLYAR